MNNHEELRQQMWELAYGLLPPDEVAALNAQIKSDPAAARLYAEVRLQADLVADAAKVADPSLQFHPQGESTVVRPAMVREVSRYGLTKGSPSARGVNWLVAVAGTGLAALLCLALFRPEPSGNLLAERFVATTVEMPSRLQAGVSQEVSISTYDIDKVSKSAEVEVRLIDGTGEERLRRKVRTDDNGHAKVELPGESIQAGVRVEASAFADGLDSDASDLSAAVTAEVVPEPIETYLLLDKPAYQPGDTVRFAVQKVKRFSKELADEVPTLREQFDSKSLEESAPATELQLAEVGQGLVTGTFQLDADPPAELYAADLQNRLAKSLAASGSQSEWYHFDQLKRSLPELAKRQTEADKLADSRFGGARDTTRQLNRSQGMLLREEASPAESSVPFAANQAGRKAVASGSGELDQLADRSESRAGVAAVELAAPPSLIAAGKPIDVPLPADASGRFLVTAKCADRFVAAETVNIPDDAWKRRSLTDLDSADALKPTAGQLPPVRLNPAPEVDGEILVDVYDNSQQPPQLVAAHRYYREPQQRLDITLLDGLKEQYAPGDRVKLLVQVLDEKAQPVDATLAVRVWNEQLVQATGSPVADLASTVFSNNSSAALEDSTLAMGRLNAGGFGSGAGQGAAAELAASKLENGSRLKSGAAALGDFAHADWLDHAKQSEYLLGDGESQRLEASNLTAVRAAYDLAVSEARQAAAQRKATIGRLLVIGGLAVVALLGMQLLLRASAKTSIWLPAIAVAAASLLIGGVWLKPSFEIGQVMQTAAVPENKRTAEPTDPSSVSAEAKEGSSEPAGDAGYAPPAEDEMLADDSRLKVPSKQNESPSSRSDLVGQLEAQDGAAGMKEIAPFAYKASPGASGPTTLSRSATASPAAESPADASGNADPAGAPAFSQSKLGRDVNDGAYRPQPQNGVEDAESAAANDDAPQRRVDNIPDRGRTARSPKPSDPSLPREPVEDEQAEKKEQQLPQPSAAASQPAPSAPAPAPAMNRDLAERASGGAGPPPPSVAGTAGAGAAALPGEVADLPKDRPQPGAAEQNFFSDRSNKNLQNGPALAKKKHESDFRRSRGARLFSGQEEPSQPSAVAPASLLFEPLLVTDSKGQAVVEFTLPAVDCEYRVLIDAIGHGRIGSLQQVIVGRSNTEADAD